MLQGTSQTWAQIRRGVPRAALLALMWWVLAAGDSAAWVVGVPAVAAAMLASLALPPALPWGWRVTGVLSFIGYFVRHSLTGGIDVAWRALHPRLPLMPAVLEHVFRLPPGPARVLFANTVSLLPGTLSAAWDAECLSVHALDGRQPIAAQLQTLETVIANLFGVALTPQMPQKE